MIEVMKLKHTFAVSEIQDGDVICFQVDYGTEKECVPLLLSLAWRFCIQRDCVDLLFRLVSVGPRPRPRARFPTLPPSTSTSRTGSSPASSQSPRPTGAIPTPPLTLCSPRR
jgi:hypothetical protein